MRSSSPRSLLLVSLVALMGPSAAAIAQPPPEDEPSLDPAAVPSPEEAARTAEEREDLAPSPEEVREALSQLRIEGGLTADEAASRAILRSPSIERAQAAVAVAEAGARQARVALYPQLDLSYRYTRLSDIVLPPVFDIQAIEDLLGVDFPDPDPADLEQLSFPVLLNNHVFTATFTYPVTDVILAVLPQYRSAQTASRAQQLQVQVREREVGIRAREALFAHAQALGALRVAEKSVEQAGAQRDRVAAMVRAGAAARVDLLRMEAVVASARVAVARAEAGVRVSREALRAVIGAPVGEDLGLDHDFEALPPPPRAGEQALLERAYERRPEVEALETLAEAQRLSRRAAGATRYPRIALQANAIYANPNARIIPQTEEFNGSWDASVIVSWSPNETVRAQRTVQLREAELAQTEAQLQELRDAIRVEVADAYHSYVAARAAYEAAQVGLVAATENHRVRTAQLEAGAAVVSDVVDAEEDLNRARLDLLDAVIAIHLAHARLEHAIGDQ